MAEHESQITWREWNEDTFADAQAQDKPILLDIGAVWCHWCHVMDTGIAGDPVHTGTYSNPDVQQRIAENFIPVKVDNDRRPDINARYNMGGWPTTAFLTPQGDILYGETYVPPPRMVGLLDYIADVYHNHKDQVQEQTAQMRAQRAEVEAPPPASDLDPQTVANVVKSLKRAFDFAYGGFGTQPKFPHPAAMQLALEQYAKTNDAELRTLIEKTLHGMADGGMYDHFAGGFFRYSTTRDWSIPHFEKMLEDNAKLTSVYALASQVLNDSYYLDKVKSAHGWLLNDMYDAETGTFAGSQDADGEERYYGQPLPVRATMPTPFIDRTIYTGWNALMVSSLVDRYKITGEKDILLTAQKTFGFICGLPADMPHDASVLLPHCYVGGEAQEVSGLLADQTATLAAALDLYEATDNGVYLDNAQRLAREILKLASEDGGFIDFLSAPEAIGELARPKKEIGDNADAALVLLRLTALTEGNPLAPSSGGTGAGFSYRRAAERALQAFSGEYGGYSYFASSYARAVAALEAALHIVIVGDTDDARTLALQRAAWQIAVPGKATETLDAEAGAGRNYPVGENGEPRAYVCLGTNCRVVATPEELASAALSSKDAQ